MFLEHRTLNLMFLVFWFFFMRAAVVTLSVAFLSHNGQLNRNWGPLSSQIASCASCTALRNSHLFSLVIVVIVFFFSQLYIAVSRRKIERTLSILAPADLNELLDIGNFGGHVGGMWVVERELRNSRSSFDVRKPQDTKSSSVANMHGPQRGCLEALPLWE